MRGNRPMSHPYAAEDYVAALAKTGGERALRIDGWNTSLLVRPIPSMGADAAGAYPMAAIAPNSDLRAGLDQLATLALVSLVLISDPLFGPSVDILAAAFPLARPFKTHYLVDPAHLAPSKHHRAEIRRSQSRCRVEHARLAAVLDDWMRLYADLVQRHAVRGVADFSIAYWRHLAGLDALEAFVAYADDEIVAMGLWLEHAGVAYNHLGASSAKGYALGASYTLYAAALEHFGGCAVINLGGGAGRQDDPSDGLARFKRGFSNGAATAYLCGAVLDPVRYAALTGDRQTEFFPAYRG